MFCGKDRRRAGESAHGQRGLRWIALENFLRRSIGFPETSKKCEHTSTRQADGRKSDDFHSDHSLDRLLVHFLRRDQQRYATAASSQLLSDGNAGKQMPACSATSDGDLWCVRYVHAACAAVVSRSLEIISSLVPSRAMLSKIPTHVSIASRFDPP